MVILICFETNIEHKNKKIFKQQFIILRFFQALTSKIENEFPKVGSISHKRRVLYILLGPAIILPRKKSSENGLKWPSIY